MKIKCISLAILFITFAQRSLAQQSVVQAYDKSQEARSKARSLYDKEHVTNSEVREAITILHNTITYLDSLPIRELEQGNLYLKARKHDIYFDLLTANLIAKDNQQALTALEKMCDEGSYFYIDLLETDSLYIPIRSDHRFTEVVTKLKKRQALWEDEPFRTALKPDLTLEEKVAGLSLLWSQAKYNFANFDHADIDWDKTYFNYLSKVTDTKNTIDYYKILQNFYALLKDGHTNVYFPRELSKDVNSRPPIRTEFIEGQVFITKVYSDSLMKLGIVPGLEILKVDSHPVLDYAKQNIEPYQSSSTIQDLQVREYSYFLLSGAENQPLTLELKDIKGRVWTKTLARTGYHDIESTQGLIYKSLGSIGYLIINNFEDRNIIKQFDSLYTQIIATKGLIIDIRNNGGGNSNIGYHILATLTDKPFKTSAYKIPHYISIPGKGMQWEEQDAEEVKPNGKLVYNKPAVLLVSARTFSAAEDFTVAFKYMKRGHLIGQTTAGSTGQPVSFNLPGGGSARVCGKHDLFPDGKEFVGIGIVPDIQIEKKATDLKEGKDVALIKALDLLNNKR
jgi:carboxyl-terminal processing protease